MGTPPSDGTARSADAGGDAGIVSGSASAETYHRGRKRAAGAGVTVLTVAGLALACLRYQPSRVQIQGESMAPTLVPGDWALVATPRRFARGDVVVVEHPARPGYEMVKRLAGLPGDRANGRTLGAGEFWVEGDHEPASTDSRDFGPVRVEALTAKVLLVYWPPERLRLVR